jgi:tetratricopeptide (TPR) repeat protein
MCLFKPVEALGRLVRKYPANYKLQKELGEYLFDGFTGFDKDWPKEAGATWKDCEKYLRAAYDHKVRDDHTAFCLGSLLLKKGRADEGLKYLEEAVRAKPDAGNTYNLALACLQTARPEKAVRYADQAFALYGDDEKKYKSDCAGVAGEACMVMYNCGRAMKYFNRADQVNPGDYFITRDLMAAELSCTLTAEAALAAGRLFALDSANPQVMRDIFEYYLGARQPAALEKLLADLEKKYSSDEAALGNIYFHRGVAADKQGDKAKAKGHLAEAKRHFLKAVPKNDVALKAIEEYLK